MKYTTILILTTVLIAGCTQSTNPNNQTARYYNTQILGVTWGFEGQCQYGNASVAYVSMSCGGSLECEVYVNGIKTNYSGGLQPCGELVAAEIELNHKPDFVAVQDGEKYFYTRRDRNKLIEVCCSNIDPTTNKLDRDNEICQTTKLDAQCPDQIAKDFSQFTMLSWELYFDGTLDFKVRNEVGQDIVIRKIYINDRTTMFSTYVAARGDSPTITVSGGPHGKVGDSYGINLVIEYVKVSDPSSYVNSTGSLTGTYN